MVLSTFFLLAIWLDPTEPSRYAQLTYGVLSGYVVYSLLLGVVMLHIHVVRISLQIVTHCIDMAVFAVLMFFTSGPTSPFFVYFVFLLVCATLRWRRRGTLWTAVAALAIVVTLAWYPSHILFDRDFELNRLIIRVVYLAVVATLLGYLGAHEQSLCDVLAGLAAWPRSAPVGLGELAREVLRHAADLLGADRMILAWEEEEEPWLHLAVWTRDEFSYSRERPDVFGAIVAEPLTGSSFFCLDAFQSEPTVIRNSPTGLDTWRGTPLQRQLQECFAIRAVLALKLKGERTEGYLLALDKNHMTADDLILGEIVANNTADRLDHFFIQGRLHQAAAADERIRLACDLHDGLLQSLTGAALQLETVQRLMETDSEQARLRIREIQSLIAGEQRDLRTRISELKSVLAARTPENFELNVRLEELAERIMRQWDLSVELNIPQTPPRITKSLSKEIYFVVHEALINAVRHAEATALRVKLSFAADRVHITVADNGHGFSFHGRYDLETLCVMKRGPVMLKERIAALGGTLTIDSREAGARLEIILPFNS
jgi:signal transduction histidine kinase